MANTQIANIVLSQMKQEDENARCDDWGVDGWFRIPDVPKYKQFYADMDRGLVSGGNCYYSNWELYKEMSATGLYKNLELVIVEIRTRRGNIIHHCFVIDGDVMYDKSQHRDMKRSLELYQMANEVVVHHYLGEDVLNYTRKEYNYLLTMKLDFGTGQSIGPLPLTKSTQGLAVQEMLRTMPKL